MLPPLVFSPFARPQVWGGRLLADRLNKSLPAGVFGESWELSDHPLHVSRVKSGPLAGVSLHELWETRRKELVGDQSVWQQRRVPGDRFPLLIKFLDCHELLSVQVHPSDALAAQWAPQEAGKTEAWVVLDASPKGRIYGGFRAGVTPAELERRLDDGTVAECLHEIIPQVGGVYFLPAGTIHAVGGGVLMAEVQQNSDATFRLFDWNRLGLDGRPRELHREASLACIDWTQGPLSAARPQLVESAGSPYESLVKCPFFELQRVRLNGKSPNADIGRLSIWMLVSGTATLCSGSERHALVSGDTLVLPAETEENHWQASDAVFLKAL